MPIPSPPLRLPLDRALPLRMQVESANIAQLAALPDTVHAFVARDTGMHQRVLKQMVVPTRLALKADAQVMLMKNVDERLVNGSVDRVLGFLMLAACAASILASTSWARRA